MVFKGPAFVGGPNITLSGTSKSVYEQLLKINPKYDPWAFPDYQKKMGAMGFAKGMDFPETANSKLIKRGWVSTKYHIFKNIFKKSRPHKEVDTD